MSPVEESSAPTDIDPCAEEEDDLNESIEMQNIDCVACLAIDESMQFFD